MKISPITVYESERELGLEQAIRQGSSIALTSVALPDPNRFPDKILQSSVATNLEQKDLYYLKSILVTSGINKNDDYFDREELWKSRATPEDKQFNLNHDGLDIVGHITDCFGVDDDLKVIAEETKVEELPDKFHILISSVLYKYWSDEKRQKLIDNTIAEIEDGKWFVSMECLFPDFDYVLIDEKSNAQIIERNNKTAFLTKHLRMYGGKGEYQDKKIGRVLRNFIFSGVGLVKQPANPESVILTVAEEKINLGYSIKDNENQEKIMEEQVKQLESENTSLKQKMAESEANLKELESNLAKANDDFAKEKAKVESLEKVLAEKDENIQKLNSELTSIAKAKKDAERLVSVKAAFKVEDEEAKEIVATLDVLSDEAFEKHIKKTVSSLAKLKVEKQEESVGATLDGVKPNQDVALAVNDIIVDSGVSEVQNDINNFLSTPEKKRK